MKQTNKKHKKEKERMEIARRVGLFRGGGPACCQDRAFF